MSTSVFGLVDGLVGLDEDGRAFALHRDSGVVVEDVASLCEVTVPPHFQVGLPSQAGGDLEPQKYGEKWKLPRLLKEITKERMNEN